MSKAFYSVNEVAAIIGLGRSKTYDLVSRGEIPSVLLGGRSRRIPAAALERFVEEQTQLALNASRLNWVTDPTRNGGS